MPYQLCSDPGSAAAAARECDDSDCDPSHVSSLTCSVLAGTVSDRDHRDRDNLNLKAAAKTTESRQLLQCCQAMSHSVSEAGPGLGLPGLGGNG